MDSLGGILIKGLLGNPILGRFNLGMFSVEVVEAPPRVWEAGGAGGAVPRRDSVFAPARKKEKDKHLIISIRLNGEVTRKTFEISDRTARISINTLKALNTVKEAAMRIFIREQKDTTTPVVRIKDD